MPDHFHVWVRSGKVFRIVEKVYNSQPVAHRAAERLKADPADRMVRKCSGCPTSAPSKRGAAKRAKRNAIVAALVADLGASPAAVRGAIARGEREAQRAEWAAATRERERQVSGSPRG